MSNRLSRPETLTALGIIVVAAGFLVPATALRPISALLPVAMLVGLIILSAILLMMDQRKAAAGTPAQIESNDFPANSWTLWQRSHKLVNKPLPRSA